MEDQTAGRTARAWRQKRRDCLLLFAFLFASFSYFNHLAPGWNVKSRLALTFAVVDQGSLSIDAYHDNPLMPFFKTNDKAFFKNHYYCDKSPGLSFAAVPVYFLLRQSNLRFGLLAGEPHERRVMWWRYLSRVSTVSLSAALLGVLLFVQAMGFGASRALGLALSVGLLWGTLLSGYATLFYPYLPASLCFVGAYHLIFLGRMEDLRRGEKQEALLGKGWGLFAAGFLTGLSWFFDFTFGLAGIGLGFYAAWALRRNLLPLWKFVLGGLIPVGVFFLYSWSIFGEFSIPYQYEFDTFFREEMAKGFGGIHAPRLSVLYYITVHPFRGLFFYSPVLLLWFAGVARGFSRKARAEGRTPDVALSVYIVSVYFLMTSGYYMWWGGWASGARHLCPAIPFFLLPMVLLLRDGGRLMLGIFALLLTLSVGLNFAITAQDPQVPTPLDGLPEPAIERHLKALEAQGVDVTNRQEVAKRSNWNQILSTTYMEARVGDNLPSPILRHSYPEFLQGHIAGNLGGEFLGLKGGWSLMPLGVLTISFLFVAARMGREKKE